MVCVFKNPTLRISNIYFFILYRVLLTHGNFIIIHSLDRITFPYYKKRGL